MKTSFAVERLLPLVFVASAVTGIGLHIAGHGISHEVWHYWAVAHVLSSFLWLISAAFHIRRHGRWYKAIALKGIGRKSRMTLALSVVFLIVAVTGIVLLACVDGANSAIGLWHYWFGIVLMTLSFIHIAKRKPKG